MQNLNKIADTLLASLGEQRRIIALENCLHTWDGEISGESILCGVTERLKALGRDDLIEEGLRFTRNNLFTGFIENSEGYKIISLAKHVGPRELIVDRPGCFHPEELTAIDNWFHTHYYEGM